MKKKWIAVVIALVVAATVGACASKSGRDGQGVASVNGEDTGGSIDYAGGDGGGSDAEFQDALIEYTECMREQGIDMPDPQANGGMLKVGPGDTGDSSEEEFVAADKRCRNLLPEMGGNLSPQDQAEMQDAMLEFTDCMRDEGIDMPDPGQGGGIEIPIDGEGGIDPNDPEFKAAEEKCRGLLEQTGGAE
jgi:hypothetical protein